MSKIESLLRQTSFLISAPALRTCPPTAGMEVAFAGRSNAGKSTAINALTGQKKLARTSKTPGRTQLINFFEVNDGARLVDLPGYGYAKVPEKVKRQWQANMGEYLEKRENLEGVIVVMDIRHPLKEFDCMMLDWAGHFQLPIHILLNKADKLKKNAANQTLFSVQRAIEELGDLVSVQLFSTPGWMKLG